MTAPISSAQAVYSSVSGSAPAARVLNTTNLAIMPQRPLSQNVRTSPSLFRLGRGRHEWNARCTATKRKAVEARRYESASSFYRPINVPRRIHILGTGSVGKFIAHSIRGLENPPPVTLLIHRPTILEEYKKEDRSITLITGKTSEKRGGFDLDLMLPERNGLRQGQSTQTDPSKFASEISEYPIHNLIVTVKATQVISALKAVKHRLSPESTILFLQNGMGIVEEVNEKIYPDPGTRPNYMLGINSHGLNSDTPCSVNHAGHGTMNIGLLPRIPFELQKLATKPTVLWGASSRYLLRTLTRIPILAAVGLSPTDLLQAQLEKLAVNCCINPLTVLLDGRNGDVLHNFHLSRVRYLLLAEISIVLQNLPELRGIPNVKLRFSPERLDVMVVGVAQKTAENISSMLQDVRRGMQTEVEYINGYVVRRGEEIGLKAVMNYMITQLVVGKQQMVSKEIDNYAPFRYRV